jgi:hypothetical protein
MKIAPLDDMNFVAEFLVDQLDVPAVRGKMGRL